VLSVARRSAWALFASAFAAAALAGPVGTERASGRPPARVAPQSPPCPASYAVGGPVGGYCGDGGYSSLARFAAPRDVAAAGNGDVLIADGQNSVIRRISGGPGGRISTVAGIGVVGDAPPRRPASVADVALADPRGVAPLPGGSFAVADAGLRAVLLVTPDGLVRTLLDRHDLRLPVDVTALGADRLAVADAGAGSVIAVDLHGNARTLARGLDRPRQLTPDPVSGGLIVSEAGAAAVRGEERMSGDAVRLAPDGRRTVVAGPGAAGPAGELRFKRVAGVVVRADGAVLVADSTVVYAVMPNGEYVVAAGGNGEGQRCGLPVGAVPLSQVEGIALVANQVVLTDARADQVEWVQPLPPAPPLPVPGVPSSDVCGAVQVLHRDQVPQPPGARVCRKGSLSPAVKAFYVDRRRRRIYVAFGAMGALQVLLVRENSSREVLLDEERFRRPSPSRQVKIRYGQRRRGPWHVRVRAPGGCHQSKLFRL
jgi:hypothetical protein